MLTFESPFYEIEDVIVFRDHASPTTFHYLAGPPHLTVTGDGKPTFLLLKYKNAIDNMSAGAAPTRDQLGGAFLMFGVDCGLPQSTKDAITSKLQSLAPQAGGPISLVPVLYTKGKVSVVALDEQKAVVTAQDEAKKSASKFVRGILGSATPSLLQDLRAIFSVSLTPDAATLIENAYESDLSPIGVMYEVEFAGLRPALAVKATVDMSRVYESLKMGLHASVGTGQAGGASKGDQTSASGGSGTQPAAAAAPAPTAAKPAPATKPAPETKPAATTPAPQGSPSGGSQSAGTSGASSGGSKTGVYVSADLDFTLEKLRQEEAIKIEIVRQQEGASVDQMQRDAMDLLKQTILNQLFAPAMSSAPTPSAADAVATATQMQQLAAGANDINKGKAGTGNNSTQVQIGFQLQYKKQEELKTATFDFSEASPETRTHAPNGFFSALLGNTDKSKYIRDINLDDEFFKELSVDIFSTDDFQTFDIQAITVDVQYRGTTDNPAVGATATFTPTKKDTEHFRAFIEDNAYSYRHQITYNFGQDDTVAAQASKIQAPWTTTTSRALVVHPPDDVPVVHVYLEPGVVDWDVVQTIQTRLIYDDPGGSFHAERVFMVSKDSKRQEWVVRLSNRRINTYRVQNRWFLADKSDIVGPVEVHQESHLFVGDPFVDRLAIIIDPVVDPNNIARMYVELYYEDVDKSFKVRKQVELSPPFKRANATIPILDSNKREYTYTASLIRTNGQEERHDPKTTDQLSVIITEGGAYMEVSINLLGGKLDALGVDAVQIDLKTDPLDGALPKIESHLFLPTEPLQFKTRLLVRADRPQAFQYRTVVMSKGNEIDSDWIKNERSILLLDVRNLLKG